MVRKIKTLTKDWSYDVVSIGYPGPVINNRPLSEPHNLGRGWAGFNFEKAFGRPTKVVNDALMQGVGSYQGGRMLFLGLGTGLGSAMIVEGILEPMELAHLPYRNGKTFEQWVGAAALKRVGRKKWQRAVDDVLKRLLVALEPDYVMLGGGNADKIDKLPRKAVRLGVASNRIGVRTIEVTGTSTREELSNAVLFRAQEDLPIPINEAVLDYQVVSERVKDGETTKRVLVAVAYRDLVESFATACSTAGIRLVGVDLEALPCCARWSARPTSAHRVRIPAPSWRCRSAQSARRWRSRRATPASTPASSNGAARC
jgi:polyphosphate glucokinase